MATILKSIKYLRNLCPFGLQLHVRYINNFTIAIRCEDKSPWERRAPLNPTHVQDLVSKGIGVIVQPSERRAYTLNEYKTAGACIKEKIDDADVILGVKEVPIEHLIPKKKFVFFSHTIKGQEHNTALLRTILNKHVCLIDYERLVSGQGKRLVAFGKYAGIGGMINLLNGIGIRLLALGYNNPFIHVAPAHNYYSTDAAKDALKYVGEEIKHGLLPEERCPMVFTFTGSGNVSQGAQDMFKQLPHEYVSPKDVKDVIRTGGNRKLYATVVHRGDYLVRRDKARYDEGDYLNHPDYYESAFAQQIAPYTTCLINGVFWKPGNPRILTTKDCKEYGRDMLAICDITADIKGTLEFVSDCTTIEAPFVLYDTDKDRTTENIFTTDKGIVLTTIENIPTQFPREATDYFGSRLKPFLLDFLKIDLDKALEEQVDVSDEVKRAIITYNGSLTPEHKYLERFIKF